MTYRTDPATSSTANWLEQAALGASALSLVHCTGLPVLLAALPAVAAIIPLPGALHVWLLGLALPLSGLSLLLGFRSHRWVLPLLIGSTGLALLGAGALILLDGPLETPFTVAGSLILATSHGLNWRRRHDRHPPD